jgi:hypothetical protein
LASDQAVHAVIDMGAGTEAGRQDARPSANW